LNFRLNEILTYGETKVYNVYPNSNMTTTIAIH